MTISLAALQPSTPAIIQITHQEQQTPCSFAPSLVSCADVNLHLASNWIPRLLPFRWGSDKVPLRQMDVGHDSAVSGMVKVELKLLIHWGSYWAQFRTDPWVLICRWGFSPNLLLRDEYSSTAKCSSRSLAEGSKLIWVFEDNESTHIRCVYTHERASFHGFAIWGTMI